MDYINPANLPIISLNITLQSEVNHFTTRWHRRIDRLTCINVNIIVIARVSTLRIHIKEHDDSMIKWKIINNFLDFRINFELDFFFFSYREWRKSCDSSVFDTERRRSGHSGWSLQCNRNFNSKFNRMLYLQHRPLQFRNGSIGYTISFHGHVDYYRLLLRTIEIHRPLMKNFNLYTFSTLKNNHISAPLLNDFKLLPS